MIAVASLEGWGLHSGAPARVAFERAPGPLRLRQGGVSASIGELVFDGERRSTTASSRDGRLRIGTVEHLFAALAGAGVREGLAITVDGPEVPLLDGGARAFLDALLDLGLPAQAAPVSIVGEATIDVGDAKYLFRPSPAGEADGTLVEVAIDFGDARIAPRATWAGDRADFRERIAVARIFGFVREIAALEGRGLAQHAAPTSVVLIDEDRIHAAGRPFTADEPARHKLLDLVGDLYAHGGPFRGSVSATRPGHGATHAAIARAFAEGLLLPPPQVTPL